MVIVKATANAGQRVILLGERTGCLIRRIPGLWFGIDYSIGGNRVGGRSWLGFVDSP